MLFCIATVPFSPLTESTRGFWFLPILAKTYLLVFDSVHPYECEVESHCGFDLHFPNDELWAFFMCLLIIHFVHAGPLPIF